MDWMDFQDVDQKFSTDFSVSVWEKSQQLTATIRIVSQGNGLMNCLDFPTKLFDILPVVGNLFTEDVIDVLPDMLQAKLDVE